MSPRVLVAGENVGLLKIHAGGKEYTVDGGFLVNEKHLEKIVTALRSRPLA